MATRGRSARDRRRGAKAHQRRRGGVERTSSHTDSGTLQRLDDRKRCPWGAKDNASATKGFTNTARERAAPLSHGCRAAHRSTSMEPIIDNEDDRTQEAVEQTNHEYNSVAAQYSKMNRHASAEHVELLLAAMPRGVAEDRRRRDAEDRAAALKVHIKELEDAGANEDEVVEAREALAKAQRDARRRVVDLGCGAGRDFPAFQERNIDYLGVDASEGMLTVARERFPEATFEAQDLCALDLPERGFDGAFANASLQHV